jgi:hypothetical protein
MIETINIVTGSSTNGERVYEEVPVVEVGNSIFRIEKSPGLVLGIANGDEIKFHPETGRYELIRRRGNIAIQVYITPAMKTALNRLNSDLNKLLGATLDGLSEKQAVFTVHASRGFAAIENILNRFVAENPGAEWYYGNIYGEDGVTPLNWWLDS